MDVIDSNKILNYKDRLPPGQYLVKNFPVLDLGFQPEFDELNWTLKVYGEVARPLTMSYKDILEMSKVYLKADFHCVTSWSKFDVIWGGVKFLDLVRRVNPNSNARVVVFECSDGYTTNVLLSELKKDNVILAYELEQKRLSKEHGGPLRIIIPSLYGWKSAKFLKGIKFSGNDEPGYWETRGYHNHGGPWKEERYS